MEVKNKRLFRLILWKSYLDKGIGLTNYIKYFIAFIALASQDVKSTLLMGFLYGIFCFILGKIWFHFRIVDLEAEVGNLYNPFVNEMRKKFAIPNNRKV